MAIQIEPAIADYKKVRQDYVDLCSSVKSILETLLKANKIDFLYVATRTKSIDSFSEKIQRKGYTSPLSEMTDLAGIRIVCYIESDVTKAGTLINETFKVNTSISGNKKDELSYDQVGYQSVHYICELDKQRDLLPENIKFKQKQFEVQIRTVLQHAWAEFEHDRNYKFSAILPPELKRRLCLVAGLLEIADKEFAAIAKDIDQNTTDVIEKTQNGDLNVDIDTTSIYEFLKNKAREIKINSYTPGEYNDYKKLNIIVGEVKDFGIKKISDLDALITKEFISAYIKHITSTTTIGFLRDILLYSNIDNYFNLSWKKNWTSADSETLRLLEEKYGHTKATNILREYDISIDDTDADDIV